MHNIRFALFAPRRAVAVTTAVLLVIGILVSGPVANAAERRGYVVTLRGAWVEEVAACTTASVNGDLSVTSDCLATGTLTGQLNGQETEDGRLVVDTAGNIKGRIDEWVYGRSSDNSCGSVHIDERFAIDPNGAVHGFGKVIGGTGQWSRARGHYEANGVIVVGGIGGYVLTLRLPKRPATSSTPCMPPTPNQNQMPSPATPAA